MEGAQDLGGKGIQLVKDGIGALDDKVNGNGTTTNGANMVQLSSMGLFMTVLAIFNR